MVSTAISLYGVTNNANKNDIKVNKEDYCRDLHQELCPAIGKVVKHDDWIFAQERAPSC